MDKTTWQLDDSMVERLFDEAYILPESNTVQSIPNQEEENTSPTISIGVQSGELAPQDKDFLTKVMAAVQVDMGLCQIIQTPKEQNVRSIVEVLTPQSKVILFGTHSPTTLTHYEVHQVEQFSILSADDLQTIQRDQGKKRLLWEALKTLFK